MRENLTTEKHGVITHSFVLKKMRTELLYWIYTKKVDKYDIIKIVKNKTDKNRRNKNVRKQKS